MTFRALLLDTTGSFCGFVTVPFRDNQGTKPRLIRIDNERQDIAFLDEDKGDERLYKAVYVVQIPVLVPAAHVHP